MTNRLKARAWLVVVCAVLGLCPRLARAQLGTIQSNVSSNSTQVHIVSSWRSTFINNVTYEAYSNFTDASVTFNWVGVGASYVAIKGPNRGLCQLELDESAVYTLDLYNDSGYDQAEEIIWTSPVLPYGEHNATITQIGEDSRLGFYPYLFTETWIQVYPTDPDAYVSTEAVTTATRSPVSTALPSPGSATSTHHAAVAPIVGGVVGGAVACALLGFLVYLWKRDKAARARGEVGGIKVQKVKRAEGKIAIDDEPKVPIPSPPAGAYDPYAAHYYQQQHPHQPPPSPGHLLGGYYQPPHAPPPPAPVHSHSLDGSSNVPLLAPGARFGPASTNPPSSPSHASYYPQAHSLQSHHSHHSHHSHSSPHAYDYPASATAGEVMPSSAGSVREGTQTYPYHTQGFGGESRTYPVPEI